MEYTSRLKKEYKERVLDALMEEFGYENRMQVPKLRKIVISRGVGAAVADKKLIDYSVEELTTIAGQRAVATVSKKTSRRLSLERVCPLEQWSLCEESVCMSF